MRKRSAKDFAIPMDEFHPKPSTAAAFADRKANDAAIENLTADLKRVQVKIDGAPDDGSMFKLLSERARLQDLLRQTHADRERTEELIKEARVK